MCFFSSKTIRWLAVLILLGFLAWGIQALFFRKKIELNYSGIAKNIILNDSGLDFNLISQADTVKDFLKEKNMNLSEYDQIIPEKNGTIFPGIRIEIIRARKIKIEADGKETENYILGKTVREAVRESGIILSRMDKTSPELNFPAGENSKIIVTRINVEEKTVQEDIDFKVIIKNDSKLGWREKKIETAGVKGAKETVYKITYKNGKEISRVKLSQKILQEPQPQIETQGTYMKLGKVAKGQGTWYAYMGGMFAASTTIPKGSYAKVTNTANGKSIVVQINDYGPQGKGRIIDLDKVAFAKIASLGAGVIGVKVEAILN